MKLLIASPTLVYIKLVVSFEPALEWTQNLTMKTTNWNPDQYLKFANERTQPSIDLVNRIEIIPHTVIDIGCGPGNSTQILRKNWNNSIIEGLDNSSQMIEKAMLDYPDQQWILENIFRCLAG